MGILVGYNIDKPEKLLVVECDLKEPDYISHNQNQAGFKNLGEFTDKPEELPEGKKLFYKEAEAAGMTHWSYAKNGDHFGVYYNIKNHPEIESYYWGDYGNKRVYEDAPRRSYDYVFVFEKGDRPYNLTLPNWKDKDKVTTSEEAVEFLASLLSESLGVKDGKLEEAEVFALKWKIPFCGKLYNKTCSNWENSNPSWDSSSKYC